ncbi:hypothetical protein [Chamaesiphon sp. OTE_75_metabat_556]|uniref:hypothetical protein n=1 Tax=Chamaesiphon sp. OTE_75_metabat_556 TaxID=2964692 RepID=UPI00286CC845|nr:hypothetical protein [Chamaesiphon sp. OTE_75_metabat_556]
MTIINNALYESVSDSATELILQPRSSRDRIMRRAWIESILFVMLAVPVGTLVPTIIISAMFSTVLGTSMPGFLNVTIFISWLAAMLKVAWDILSYSGYMTFIFDRVQQQFVINIANIFGRNSVQIIPFDRIADVQLDERNHDGMSVEVFLTLKAHQDDKSAKPQKIVLSRFSSEEYRTVANLTLREEHQELLLVVRTTLGFSTKAILDKLQQNLPIPTEEELQAEKAQAILAGQEKIKNLSGAIFASKQDKQDRLGTLRSQTIQFPEDPQIWQDFALQLAMQKNLPRAEIIDAYRHAEALYLDSGDTDRALAVTRTIEGILSRDLD